MQSDDAARNLRITIDPQIMVGKPVVSGTRIPVELVLKRLAKDLDVQGVLEAFPRLTREDVMACIEYARARVQGEEVYPLFAGRPPVPDAAA